METKKTYLDYLETVAAQDVTGLRLSHKSYGDSCLRRGGVGLYMMFVRKSDRIEHQVKMFLYDLFAAYKADDRKEGVLDDIRDLRRYLMIAEAELMATYGLTPDDNPQGVDLEGSEPDGNYTNQDGSSCT